MVVKTVLEAHELNHKTSYDSYYCEDRFGRTWTVCRDASILPILPRHHELEDGNFYKCELITPVLNYDDLKTILQPIIRQLRHAGAKVNTSCGIHVHVSADGQTPLSLRNLCNFVASHENLLYTALAVNSDRTSYFQKNDSAFLRRLNVHPVRTIEELSHAWYNDSSRAGNHYDASRYHFLYVLQVIM